MFLVFLIAALITSCLCTAQASAWGGRSFLPSFSSVKYTAGSQSADTEARGSEYLFDGRRTKGKCGRV